jgi:hypothetical protein
VNIGPRADTVTLRGGLLRGHVGERSEDSARPRPVRPGVGQHGQAEIRDLGYRVGRQEDIGGFEVAVDHPSGVGVIDRAGKGFDQYRRLARVSGASRQVLG